MQRAVRTLCQDPRVTNPPYKLHQSFDPVVHRGRAARRSDAAVRLHLEDAGVLALRPVQELHQLVVLFRLGWGWLGHEGGDEGEEQDREGEKSVHESLFRPKKGQINSTFHSKQEHSILAQLICFVQWRYSYIVFNQKNQYASEKL